MTSLLLSPAGAGVAAARWLALRSVLPLRAAELSAALAVLASGRDGAMPGQWLLLSDASASVVGAGQSQWLQLVWPADAQPGKGRISLLSPLGLALIGKTPGAQIRLSVCGVIFHFQLQELMAVRRKPTSRRPV